MKPQEVFSETKPVIMSAVSFKELKHYFMKQGYKICNLTPIRDTTNWFAILIYNNEYHTATVFTKDKEVLGFESSAM